MLRSLPPLAIVTVASTGIGYELAKCCARNGFDLIIAADEPQIDEAAGRLRAFGVRVDAIQADLATTATDNAITFTTRGDPQW